MKPSFDIHTHTKRLGVILKFDRLGSGGGNCIMSGKGVQPLTVKMMAYE